MVILNSVACLLSLFLQEPDQPQADTPAILNAHLLPRDTLAAIALNPLGPHREALAKTGIADLLNGTVLAGESGKLFEVTVRGFAQIAGIDPDNVDQLIQNGLVLALTGIRGNQPDWIFALDAGDLAPQLRTVLAKLRIMMTLQGWRADGTEHVDTKIWTFRNSGMTLAHAAYESWVFFGSTSLEVQHAVDRAAGRLGNSLRNDATYELFELQTRKDRSGNAPLVS